MRVEEGSHSWKEHLNTENPVAPSMLLWTPSIHATFLSFPVTFPLLRSPSLSPLPFTPLFSSSSQSDETFSGHLLPSYLFDATTYREYVYICIYTHTHIYTRHPACDLRPLNWKSCVAKFLLVSFDVEGSRAIKHVAIKRGRNGVEPDRKD